MLEEFGGKPDRGHPDARGLRSTCSTSTDRTLAGDYVDGRDKMTAQSHALSACTTAIACRFAPTGLYRRRLDSIHTSVASPVWPRLGNETSGSRCLDCRIVCDRRARWGSVGRKHVGLNHGAGIEHGVARLILHR
jgi:hypothetical protein